MHTPLSTQTHASLGQAPAWSPSLSDYPGDEPRPCAGIHASVAVPLCAPGASGPSAVVEVVLCARRLCVGDLLTALVSSLVAAGVELCPSVNRSMCLCPPVINDHGHLAALAQLSLLCGRLVHEWQLPIAQIWVPCIIADDTQPEESQSRAAAAVLQCRSMPCACATPAAWAFHTACAERSLPTGAGLPGAAWHLRGCVWAPAPECISRRADPLQPWSAMCGFADCGALTFCATPSAGTGSRETYVVHCMLPCDRFGPVRDDAGRLLRSYAAAAARHTAGVATAACTAAAASCLAVSITLSDCYRLSQGEVTEGWGMASPPGPHGRTLPAGFFKSVESQQQPEGRGVVHGAPADTADVPPPSRITTTTSGRVLRPPVRYKDGSLCLDDDVQ